MKNDTFFKAIKEADLKVIHGGMFAPFINHTGPSGLIGTPSSSSSAAGITPGSLGKAMTNGAVQAGFGAAVASKDPRVIGTATAGGAILAGMGHCIDNMKMPTAKPIALESCLLPYGSTPKFM